MSTNQQAPNILSAAFPNNSESILYASDDLILSNTNDNLIDDDSTGDNRVRNQTRRILPSDEYSVRFNDNHDAVTTENIEDASFTEESLFLNSAEVYHRKHKNSIDEAELTGCCGRSSQGKEPKGKEGIVYLKAGL